jgi:hypothetical protein
MKLTAKQLKLDAAWKQAYRAMAYLAKTRNEAEYMESAGVLGDAIRAIRAEMETL